MKSGELFFFTAFTAITAFLTKIHRIHRISYENLPKNLDPGPCTMTIPSTWKLLPHFGLLFIKVYDISVYFVLELQVSNIKLKIDSYFKYIRLPYNLTVVSICAVLYWRCILRLRNSSIDRVQLLTVAFAANLLSWVITVLPHLVFIDFVWRVEQIEPVEYFQLKYALHYLYGSENGRFSPGTELRSTF